MTSIQISKQAMFVRLEAYLKANASIVDILPYPEHFTEFYAGISKTKALSQEQMYDKSGFIKTKKRFKLALVQPALDISRKMHAYATFTGKDVLSSEISFSESDLKYASDDDLIKYAQGIHDRALANLADLAGYDITAETLTALQTAINDFETSIPNASLEKSSSKENTAQIAASVKATEDALDKIDVTIEIVRLKEPKFYNEYKNLRKSPDTGKRTLALIGSIIDAETKLPVKNVKIVFTLKGNGNLIVSGTNGSIVKTSADKGGFTIKSMPGGMYEVVISKNGYAEQKITIAVTSGELVKLNVELVKSKE